MKNAPRKPMVLAIIAIFVLISPIYAESASNLEKYLDCSSEKKIDIAFVFDTTNSMGGEISELRATANKFATDLDASNIDYQLGLVEFRDFHETCDGFSCGSPGDYAYSVKGNGTLTSEIDTFGSWLKELKAGGGGSPGPEAVLAALRHAGSDLSWRIDAEKAIIVLTDAGAHPDGSCCNAEGDTLEGTIFELVDIGARAYIIGPEDASLEMIAENTGGQFYEIRSGLSLKPLLEEITKSLGCSFRTDVATVCENNQLEVSVQLIGKETIPYISGQTEAWMYLDQAGSISRFNLSYDREAEAYLASVPDVCGSIELTVYGRAGERSAVQTVQVECGACGAEAAEESSTLSISGWAYDDSNSDGDKGADEAGLDGWKILLLKPDGSSIAQESDRNGYYIFTGLIPGSYKVVANAQDNWTATAPETGMSDVKLADVHESEIDFGFKLLITDQASPQIGGSPNLTEPFNRTFGGDGWDVADSVQPTPDGGYILAGRTSSSGGYFNDGWLIKTDSQGHEMWDKRLGISATWIGKYSVQPTAEGGYIISGTCYSLVVGDLTGDATDLNVFNNSAFTCLIKIDSKGDEVWKRAFGGSNWYYGASLQPTTDGGYILAGSNEDEWNHTNDGPLLIKINSQGNEIWERIFIEDIFDVGWGSILGGAYSVQPTIDGGYILTGNVCTQMGSNGWLIKTDSEGHEIWGKNLPDSKGNSDSFDLVSYQVAYSMHTTSDGGYILAGERAYVDEDGNLDGESDTDVWLARFDAEGNELWNRTFGEAGSMEIAYSVQPTIDGGFIIAGTKNLTTFQDFTHQMSYNPDISNSDAWIIKTDAKGNEIWNKTFGGIRDDFANSIQLTSDGGYIVAGSTTSFGKGSLDAWLLKIDSNGNTAVHPDLEG